MDAVRKGDEAEKKLRAARQKMEKLESEIVKSFFPPKNESNGSPAASDRIVELKKWGPPVYIRHTSRHPEIIRVTSTGISVEQSRNVRTKT